LQQRVERYGPDLLQAPCQYQVAGAALAGQALTAADITAVTDFFAPAQFITMTDAQKLSAPSFESMRSGVTLGPAALTLAQTPASGGASTVTVTSAAAPWDMLVLDSPDPAQAPAPALAPAPAPAGPVTLPASLLATQLAGAAAAVYGPGGRGSAAYAGQASANGITMQQPTYAVTGMDLSYAPVADRVPAGLAADGPGLFRMPTAAAAASAGLSGAAGQQWQVVYHSEVAGTWAT